MFYLLLLGLLSADDRITVDRHAPTTQLVPFDPAHPPSDMVKLQHGEDALTRMLFNCNVHLKYDTIEKHFSNGQWHVVAKLQKVDVTLDLANTIYLPEHVDGKLRAHELGHAKINAMIYEADADDSAREAAREGLMKRWEGAGKSIDAAGKAATDVAVDWIAQEYLHHTADKAFRIGEIYDDLTRHGTNYKQVDDAIREATEKQSQESKAG